MKKFLLVIPFLYHVPLSYAGPNTCAENFTSKKISAKPGARLFQGKDPVQLSLMANFKNINIIARSEEFHENKDDPKFVSYGEIADLQHPEKKWKVAILPRGETSLSPGEGDFPKLKIKFEKNADTTGSLFEKTKKFRVNTHVSTKSSKKLTPIGRRNDEASPLREGLAYSLAEVLELSTPATKLARIQYVDSATGEKFSRAALLIETDKDIAERRNAEILEPNVFLASEKSGISALEGARFHLFQKLLGNNDVGLRVHERPVASREGTYLPLKNTLLLKDSQGKITPVVYDFDVSTFVSGYELISPKLYANPYFGLKTHENSFFVTTFMGLRQKFTHAELQTAIDLFKEKKKSLYKTVQTAWVDDAGRANALKHLDTFFENIDGAMNLPVIAQEKVILYKDPQKKIGKLKEDPFESDPGDPGFLRPGTPVVILERTSTYLKVAILDINFDLLPGEDPVGYISPDTLIGPVLPEKFVGQIDHRDLSF